MSFITLDFETSFSSGKGETKEKFSLSDMTYEEYLRGDHFFVYGVGIKIDRNQTVWYNILDHDIEQVLNDLFTPDNEHTMLCHNTMFDAAILEWFYGLRAKTYYCTMMMSYGLWRYESASLAKLAMRLWPNNKKKRKGKELAVADGLLKIEDYTREIIDYVGKYCIQDCELTFDAFVDMYPAFPAEELEVIDDIIKMFVQRPLELDYKLVIEYATEINETRQAAFDKAGIDPKILASSDKFVAYLKEHHDITMKKVPSPTIANPKNMKWPLAKNSVPFIKLRAERPDLNHLWEGRIAATSNQERTRCQRFLSHGDISQINPLGRIAIPLKYCGAGTTRFSGTNSINMQNLGRYSKLRNALRAPKGYKLGIADLGNIEGKMNAYHACDWDKLNAYANGIDFYNALASEVFGYEVDRKLKDENDKKVFGAEGALGKTGELGLGFGMGDKKFLTTCHEGPMGEPPMLWVDEELALKTVQTWRGKNVPIVNSWRIADEMLAIMADPTTRPFHWNTVEIHHQGFRLPSGLFVQYPRLKYDKSVFKNDDGSDRWTWMYWNGKYWKDTWGGTVIENIVQAISRVVMTQAEIRIKQRMKHVEKFLLALQVHDELVFCFPEEVSEEASGVIQEELVRVPKWADDRLPLTCSFDLSEFYMKG